MGELEHKTSFLWVLVDLMKCPLMEAKNYEKWTAQFGTLFQGREHVFKSCIKDDVNK